MPDTRPGAALREPYPGGRSLLDVEIFVVACPKSVTMYEDAIKTSGRSARIELRELNEQARRPRARRRRAVRRGQIAV